MKKNNLENSEATPETTPATATEADPHTAAATPAADPPRESERIAKAIAAAEARLQAIHDTVLPALEQELDAIAGAAELDDGAVADLTTRKAVLLDEAGVLKRRIQLLTEQREEAEKGEAQERMAALTREQKDLAASGAGLKEQWDLLFISLWDKSKEFWPVIKKYQELGYEKEWLKTRYSIELLPSDGFARPTTQELRPLDKSIEDLLRNTSDPWLIQKRDLLNIRARALPKPQGVFESHLVAIPEHPTAPATPPQPPPPAAETHHPLSMAERSIRKEG